MAHRLSTIVTRTGDDGTTGLGDGSRLPKNTRRIAALGELDELNAALGLLLTEPIADPMRTALVSIQHDLFDLGGELCIPDSERLSIEAITRLDQAIADYNASLPRLAEFVLPGGSRAAAQAHVARTVCRRAERTVVGLAAHDLVRPACIHYLNRLSDLLFVLARVFNRAAHVDDVLWQPHRDRNVSAAD